MSLTKRDGRWSGGERGVLFGRHAESSEGGDARTHNSVFVHATVAVCFAYTSHPPSTGLHVATIHLQHTHHILSTRTKRGDYYSVVRGVYLRRPSLYVVVSRAVEELRYKPVDWVSHHSEEVAVFSA